MLETAVGLLSVHDAPETAAAASFKCILVLTPPEPGGAAAFIWKCLRAEEDEEQGILNISPTTFSVSVSYCTTYIVQ